MTARVRRVTSRGISAGSRLNDRGSISANTGVAPTWQTEVAVAMKVIDGTITSSPGPMPSASSIAARAVVPLAKLTACAQWCRAANSRSKSAFCGPFVRIPLANTSRMASISASPTSGFASRIRGVTSGMPLLPFHLAGDRIAARVTVTSLAGQYRPGGSGQHDKVELKTLVLDVAQVPFDAVGPVQPVTAVHLSQAGQPGRHGQPAPLPHVVPPDLVGQRRPRADHAHLAARHVDQLGKLVDGQPAQPAADPGAVRGLRENAALVAVAAHRPQLQHDERPTVPPGAHLAEQDRPPVIQPDGRRGKHAEHGGG